MKKNKEKDNCSNVKAMILIKKKLSKKYMNNTELLFKDLNEINKKYKLDSTDRLPLKIV